MTLPDRYMYLYREGGPPMLLEALKLFGVKELAGQANNPVIIAWAQEVADTDEVGEWLADFYREDSTPWCGLFMAVVAKRAGAKVFNKCLSARAWESWGEPASEPMLGDVMVFWRKSRDSGFGHVGLYVGEDQDAYHILGGNQGDEVCVTRLTKDRFVCARRQKLNGLCLTIRKIELDAFGPVSRNEQ